MPPAAALVLFCLDRHQKNIAPQRAANPTTPTTTPAAIAAVFLLCVDFSSILSKTLLSVGSDVAVSVVSPAVVEVVEVVPSAPVVVLLSLLLLVVVVDLESEESEYVGTSSSKFVV